MTKRRKVSARLNPRKINLDLVVSLRLNGATWHQIADRLKCSMEGARSVYRKWELTQAVVPAVAPLAEVPMPNPRPRLCDELGIKVCYVERFCVTANGWHRAVISLPFVSILDGVPA